MSSPIGKEERVDDPMRYAPRWARAAGPGAALPSQIADAPPTAPSAAPPPAASSAAAIPPATPPRASAHLVAPRIADAPLLMNGPPMAPGIGGPNLPPPKLRPFAGDVAVRDLRRRLSLDPDLALQPPMQTPRESVVPWVGRLAFVLIAAAGLGFGITLLTVPNEMRRNGIVGTMTPIIEDLSRASREPAHLVVEGQKGFANDPLPLGVALNEATGAEMLTLVGLAHGTRLTAGTPLGLTGWQLNARELGRAFAYAPKDFVGVMDAAVDLRSPRDRLMDSQIVRLEWVQKKHAKPEQGKLEPSKPEPSKFEPTKLEPSKLEPSKPEPSKPEPSKPEASKPEPGKLVLTKPEPPKPALQPLEPEEIATLLKRAEDFLKIGDIAAARLALRRAAAAGNAQAALSLGMTFDAAVLAEQGVLGLAPDEEQARAWYQRAADLGSTEARRRLERLAVR
jgi:hypothetical protein